MTEYSEELEKHYREHYTDNALNERIFTRHMMRLPENPPSEYAILAAINETRYKYFGDYEFSEQQANAVLVLVDAALELIKQSKEAALND